MARSLSLLHLLLSRNQEYLIQWLKTSTIPKDLRNIGIQGSSMLVRPPLRAHSLLHRQDSQIGEVHLVRATMGWMVQERARRNHYVRSNHVLGRMHYPDHRPGHVDFTAEVDRSLRFLTVPLPSLMPLRVSSQSETVWRQAASTCLVSRSSISLTAWAPTFPRHRDHERASVRSQLRHRFLWVPSPTSGSR